MAARRPLRDELVRRALIDPAGIEAALAANRVRVNGAVVVNPSSLVAPGDSVSVAEEPSRYVSRGGVKLEGAIADLGVVVSGRRCLDAGSSTGGFTDCLLQHGAVSVLAIDVGRGQLHNKLVMDPRVTSWESRNILDVSRPDVVAATGVDTGVDLVVADLSFTSSARLAGHLVDLVAAGENCWSWSSPSSKRRGARSRRVESCATPRFTGAPLRRSRGLSWPRVAACAG